MVLANAGEWAVTPSQKLQAVLDHAVTNTVRAFAKAALKPDELAATVYDLSDPKHAQSASFRGAVQIYPASIVKLFYLEAAHRWMEDGKVQDTAELRRAMRDMIVDSSNDATHYVLDLLTGTTAGPELPPAEMEAWGEKRNAVNRYFAARGYTNVNVNQKPWGDGPYGRERAYMREKGGNRNALTTDATARLLAEIVTGRSVSAKRSAEMMELLRRDPFAKTADLDDQAHGFSGTALPPGTKLWSKAGWTSETRHDAAYVELPDGKNFLLVIFTVNHANEREIIPTVVREILSAAR